MFDNEVFSKKTNDIYTSTKPTGCAEESLFVIHANLHSRGYASRFSQMKPAKFNKHYKQKLQNR